MSIVYVVQNQHRFDKEKGIFVPKFSLEEAKEYGELSYLLGPTASPFRPEPIIEEMQRKLWSFSDDDYLLLVGNPILIGCAVAIAAEHNEGKAALLQWSGTDRRYIPVNVNLKEKAA